MKAVRAARGAWASIFVLEGSGLSGLRLAYLKGSLFRRSKWKPMEVAEDREILSAGRSKTADRLKRANGANGMDPLVCQVPSSVAAASRPSLSPNCLSSRTLFPPPSRPIRRPTGRLDGKTGGGLVRVSE